MSSSAHSQSPDGEQGLDVEEEAAAETEATEETSEELSLNVVYDILKNKRRRHVLHLLDEEGSTTLGDLAEQIAAIENDKPRKHLNAQERKRVYVGLYQCHLPRMDDADVIDFDGDRGTVELGTHAEEVYEHLQTAEADDDPVEWPKYYGLYGVGGVVLGAAFSIGAPATVGLVGMVLLLGGVAVMAALHYLAEQE